MPEACAQGFQYSKMLTPRRSAALGESAAMYLQGQHGAWRRSAGPPGAGIISGIRWRCPAGRTQLGGVRPADAGGHSGGKPGSTATSLYQSLPCVQENYRQIFCSYCHQWPRLAVFTVSSEYSAVDGALRQGHVVLITAMSAKPAMMTDGNRDGKTQTVP